MNRIITLTTDFGSSDGFVGTMKGVILSINPNAVLVDITHDIAPQNIEQGAFLLATSAKYFPADAIHVVVVDPGVGSTRRAVAIQVRETIYVAPDNGVLTFAIQAFKSEIRDSAVTHQPSAIRAVHLNKPEYWLPRVSNTFHGRDIFAPVAAHLSLGVPLEALGDPIDDWVRLSWCETAFRAGDEIAGRVVHIDRFGNLVTNIGEESLAGMDRARVVVRIGAKRLHGVKATFADAARGELVALIGSSWYLEIAVREGNAAQALGIRVGDEIGISLDRE